MNNLAIDTLLFRFGRCHETTFGSPSSREMVFHYACALSLSFSSSTRRWCLIENPNFVRSVSVGTTCNINTIRSCSALMVKLQTAKTCRRARLGRCATRGHARIIERQLRVAAVSPPMCCGWHSGERTFRVIVYMFVGMVARSGVSI